MSRWGGFRKGRQRYTNRWDELKSAASFRENTIANTPQEFSYVEAQGILNFDAAFDLVIPYNHTATWILKAPNGLNTIRDGGQHLARLRAPRAVVPWLLLGRHLLLTQGVEFCHGHVAGVNLSGLAHLIEHSAVAIHALHLVERTFIRVHPQPSHAFQNHVDCRLR